MARKRRRKRGGSRGRSSGLSDGVRQSIFAICLAALGIFFLFSFFALTGSVGLWADHYLALGFGWDRWLFALVLFVVSWHILFPSKSILGAVNYIGLVLFFLAFNGLLNLFFIEEGHIAAELQSAGGYLGMIVSHWLVYWIGFWGASLAAFATLCIGIILLFDVSLQSMLTVPAHFSQLGAIMKRSGHIDHDEEELDEEEFEDEYMQEVEDNEEDEEVSELVSHKSDTKSHDGQESESVMTSRRRRKVEVPLNLLDESGKDGRSGDIERSQEVIRKTFENFGIDVEMADVRVGPTVTQYALRPAQGIKLSRIIALHNDLALALAAHPIRIEAPIPRRSLVGIEVPNQKVGMVCLRELMESKAFKHRKTHFTAPLGRDVGGGVNMVSVDKAPHILVAGATGSGKSVCLNEIILSLLYQNGPDDLKMIMVDPKRVELGVYTGIPHLLIPPITKVDEAINALKWAVREMERRLDHLAKQGTRDIDAYNKKCKDRMPKIVIVIDELADLMSQNKRDVEAVIVRIAQMARAVGIHLILATQRPSVDVITGLIKANIPTRLAFAVASQVDSKTILDQAGAEKLLGRGDMLLTTPQISKPKRIQGAYVSDKEIERVVAFLKEQGEPDYNYQVTEDARAGGSVFSHDDADPLLEDAIAIVIESGKASTSFLQRRIKIGYSRAARIIDMMEEMGIVGPQNGSKPRDVLVDDMPGKSKDKAAQEGEVATEQEDQNNEHDEEDNGLDFSDEVVSGSEDELEEDLYDEAGEWEENENENEK